MNPSLPSVPIERSRPGIEAAKSFAEELRERLENVPASRKIVIAKRDLFGRIRYRSYGYAELCQASQALAASLVARGVGPGTRTLVLVAPGFDFFVVMLALIHAGAVPVLLDPGVGMKQMLSCIRDAEVEAMIGEPRA